MIISLHNVALATIMKNYKIVLYNIKEKHTFVPSKKD